MSMNNKLKILRKNRNLTQDDVEKLTGISRSSIALYELGERKPSIEKLIKLALLYHCSLDYICEIDEEREMVDIKPLNPTDKNKVKLIIEKNYNIEK